MTNNNPFAEARDRDRRRVRTEPIAYANDLADQHFAEALDMLTENARDTLVELLYDDLNLNLPNQKFEELLDAYQARLNRWFAQTSTELTKDD